MPGGDLPNAPRAFTGTNKALDAVLARSPAYIEACDVSAADVASALAGAANPPSPPSPPPPAPVKRYSAAWVDALQRSSGPDNFTTTERELAAVIGERDPRAAARRMRAEADARKREEEEETARRDAARVLVREQLGEWTKESQKRLEQTKPSGKVEETDAKKLTAHVWSVARLAACGSLNDLAYAVSQMMSSTPVEVVGAWIVEAMGLRGDGEALRQLFAPKARRKLVRSYVLWHAGRNMRLREIAGSPSRRTIRGVKRVPQRLLARVSAIGGRPWHRSTTTRDANETHAAGLWRRVRMRRDLAHESERCGPSQQVVSRYWMELPRDPSASKSVSKRERARGARGHARRRELPEQLGDFMHTRGAQMLESGDGPDPFGWLREHGKQALVYATRAVKLVRGVVGSVFVPGMLHPLQTASPPA